MSEDIVERLSQRREQLVTERQQLMEAANNQIAQYNGQITEIDRTLALLNGDDLPEDDRVITTVPTAPQQEDSAE